MEFPGGWSASSRLGRLIRTAGSFVVLLIAMWWQIEVCYTLFGVHGHAFLAVLVLGWMSQTVQCVLDARRGLTRDSWSQATVLAGLLPWIMLPILYAMQVGGTMTIWQSAPIPLAARGLGAVLALGVVLTPSRRGEPLRPGTGTTPELTVQSQLLLISTLLISGSPVFALFTLYWLAVAFVSHLLQPAFATAAVQHGAVRCQSLELHV
jgi:hypothetical protein